MRSLVGLKVVRPDALRAFKSTPAMVHRFRHGGWNETKTQVNSGTKRCPLHN